MSDIRFGKNYSGGRNQQSGQGNISWQEVRTNFRRRYLEKGGWRRLKEVLQKSDEKGAILDGRELQMLNEVEKFCRRMAEECFGKSGTRGSSTARLALNKFMRYARTGSVGLIRYARWAEHMQRRRLKDDRGEAEFFEFFAEFARRLAADIGDASSVLVYVMEGVVARV